MMAVGYWQIATGDNRLTTIYAKSHVQNCHGEVFFLALSLLYKPHLCKMVHFVLRIFLVGYYLWCYLDFPWYLDLLSRIHRRGYWYFQNIDRDHRLSHLFSRLAHHKTTIIFSISWHYSISFLVILKYVPPHARVCFSTQPIYTLTIISLFVLLGWAL